MFREKKTLRSTPFSQFLLRNERLVSLCVYVCVCVCSYVHAYADNFDFEHLSNSLFHEWNHFQCNDLASNSIQSSSNKQTTVQQRNRIELEKIFVRVGLQIPVACKLADEVYNKLGLSADQTISFDDFLSLLQCNAEQPNQHQHQTDQQRQWQTIIRKSNTTDDDDEYTTSPMNDHMIIDLHASHSGLCDCVYRVGFHFLFFLNVFFPYFPFSHTLLGLQFLHTKIQCR